MAPTNYIHWVLSSFRPERIEDTRIVRDTIYRRKKSFFGKEKWVVIARLLHKTEVGDAIVCPNGNLLSPLRNVKFNGNQDGVETIHAGCSAEALIWAVDNL